MATLASRFTITINGEQQESLPGATLDRGGINVTAVVTDQGGIHGSEEQIAAAGSAA